ncbi:odorant receptor 13a-like [Chelonus insularis]|uniref:odorant receptor 13a-like n=1 Tax=Chelonus insularis TaxID=460826 RepID=UPI00158B2534|nr:odorant receptor 13a-like [Chelonus insularis]
MSFAVDNLSTDKCILLNKKILKIAGLYPISLIKYAIFLFCSLLLVIPEVVRICKYPHDLEVILETSSVLLTMILTIFKFTLWIFQRKTQNLIGFLFNSYWDVIVSLKEVQCIYDHALIAKKLTLSYTCFIMNAVIVFYFIPIRHIFLNKLSELTMNNNHHYNISIHFPFAASYPQFCYESPYFQFVYFSQIISTSICALITLGVDTIIATAIFYACGHFSCLQKKLEKLNFRFNVNTKLINYIKHHKIALRFSEQIEETFNSIILLQVLASSLIICLVGFQVNSRMSQSDKLMEYLSYLLMALFQLILFCWPGDKLIKYSSIISNAIYSTNWYESKEPVKIEIITLIHRAQKPCFLTAGKFQQMSLESFNTILSTSLSYFMLLKHFDSDET